jgi:predicted XRE-type DNA-binding protein
MRRRGSDGEAATLGSSGMESVSARTRLARRLNKLLDERELSQTEAAEILGIPQPRISAIRNYKLQGISLERLMEALMALGQDVEIRVSPSVRQIAARIQVAT